SPRKCDAGWGSGWPPCPCFRVLPLMRATEIPGSPLAPPQIAFIHARSQPMKIRHLLVAASLAALLAACARQEDAPPADAPADAAAEAAPATDAAATDAAATAAVDSGLPQACEDYLN